MALVGTYAADKRHHQIGHDIARRIEAGRNVIQLVVVQVPEQAENQIGIDILADKALLFALQRYPVEQLVVFGLQCLNLRAVERRVIFAQLVENHLVDLVLAPTAEDIYT